MALKDDPLLKDIVVRIQAQRNNIAHSLINGTVGSYDRYQYMVGVAKGLEEAIAILHETVKNYTHDDDDGD